MLIGHRRVLDELEACPLPAATLLLGPEGTGKWSLALVLAGHLLYQDDDVLALKDPLVTEHVRHVQAFCRTAASGPHGKLVILGLDDAQAGAQNALLKLLEEPPDGVRLILVAGEPPLPTIVSRSCVKRCGLLSTDEVEQVLLALRWEPAEARAAALIAGGRVSIALRSAGAAADVLGRVKAAVRAASDRNTAALGTIGAKVWDERHHLLFRQWAAERYAYSWAVFSPQEAPGFSRDDAKYALHMLSGLDGARPWLLDRAVLENLAARGGSA